MGLTPAITGSIRFDGNEIRGLAAYQVAKLGIGLVPEGRQVFPNLTRARESGRDRGQSQQSGRAVDFGQSLRAVSTAGRAHGEPGEPALRRRAADAGDRPRADDQSSALDPRRGDGGLAPLIRAEIWQCLTQLKAAGQSILVIDKNVEALIRIADRHYLIERGKVVWTGSSAELAAAPAIQHRYLGV